MPQTVERQLAVEIIQRPFSHPEWTIIPGFRPGLFSQAVYLRQEQVTSRSFPPHTIIVLDEKIEVTSPTTEVITQWILGHHSQLLPLSRMHQGWQGDEMIRRFYRMKIVSGDHEDVILREIDISGG